jgi:hypothetical protein
MVIESPRISQVPMESFFLWSMDIAIHDLVINDLISPA